MATLFRVGLENAAVATVLALLVAVFGRVVRRRAALVHVLWVVVLLKLVAPPMFGVPLPNRWAAQGVDGVDGPTLAPRMEGTPEGLVIVEPWSETDSRMTGAESSEPWSDPPDGASNTPPQQSAIEPLVIAARRDESLATGIVRLLGGLWLIGTLVSALVAAIRIVRFRRVLRSLSPASKAVEDVVRASTADLRLRRVPEIRMASGTVAPMVWCLGRTATLVIPTDLWNVLDERGRVTLVAHELAHLKRGDHWARLLETLVTVLYWWLPTVWWVRSALREVEERCCDAWVVWAYPEDARAYAETLLETVDFLARSRSNIPALASGFGRVHSLKRRLTMILRGTTTRTLGLGGGLFALALSATLLPFTPTFAQDAKPPAETPSGAKDDAITFVPSIDAAPTGRFFLQFTPDGKAVTTVQEGLPGGVTKASEKDQRLAIVVGSDEASDVVRSTVVVATEDGEKGKPEVYSGEIKEIVAKLRVRIDELKAKKEKSKADEQKIEALSRIVESLERSGAGTLGLKLQHPREDVQSGQPARPDGDPAVVLLRSRINDLKGIAETQEAALREASQKLAETREKLAEAAQKLAKLVPNRWYKERVYTVTRPEYTVTRPAPPNVHYDVSIPVRQVPPPAANDQERRLADVEKKLERILNQLESIKKGDSKSK